MIPFDTILEHKVMEMIMKQMSYRDFPRAAVTRNVLNFDLVISTWKCFSGRMIFVTCIVGRIIIRKFLKF